MNIFSKYLFLWQIITILFGVVLMWSIGRILGLKKFWHAVVMSSMLLLVGFYMLTSAGIFATTINYLWPLASLAFVAAMFLRPFARPLLRKITTILCIPLFIFAVCNEQIAVFASIVGLSVVAYKLYKKQKVPIVLWVYIGIAILGVVNTLIAPGNDLRYVIDEAYWWPGFQEIPIQNKLAIGFVVTFSRLFLTPEMMAILLVGLLLVYAFMVKNRHAFVALIPAAVLITLFYFPVVLSPGPEMGMQNFFHELRVSAMNMSPEQLVSGKMMGLYMVIFGVISFSIFSAIVFLYGKTKRTYYTLVLLGAGLAVALALSLSPTLFASGARTLYPLIMILVAVNSLTLIEILDLRFGKDRKPLIKTN